jgi:hypothetical protein
VSCKKSPRNNNWKLKTLQYCCALPNTLNFFLVKESTVFPFENKSICYFFNQCLLFFSNKYLLCQRQDFVTCMGETGERQPGYRRNLCLCPGAIVLAQLSEFVLGLLQQQA